MRPGPSTERRLAAKIATVVGLLVLAAGITHANGRHDDEFTQSAQRTNTLALTDPQKGQEFALAFGDSYFTGSENVTEAQGFGRIALNDLGYSVDVRGHGGTGYVTASHVDGWPNYVSQVSGASLTDLPYKDFRVVLLEGGINDARVDADPRLVQLNANWVMRALSDRYPNAIHLVLGVPADTSGVLRGKRLAVSRAISRAADAARWRYLDPRSLITPRTVKQIIGSDGLHPTVAGHAEMAKALQRLLIKAGVPKKSMPGR